MPVFDETSELTLSSSPFLRGVMAAFRARRKALIHKARQIEADWIAEPSDQDPPGLEISCVASGRTRIRLRVWDDRWVWIDARRNTKRDGWLFQYSHDGRIFGEAPEPQIVSAFERSIAAAFEMTSNDLDRFRDIWEPMLARGPRKLMSV